MQALLLNMEVSIVYSSNTKKSKWRLYIYIYSYEEKNATFWSKYENNWFKKKLASLDYIATHRIKVEIVWNLSLATHKISISCK
jgi:hypothetical protein